MKEITSSEVAEILGVSQEQFSKFWQVCQRFPGSFVAPVRTVGRSQLWDEVSVNRWVMDHQ